MDPVNANQTNRSDVSPARAGMDPCPSPGNIHLIVSPARAGMDPPRCRRHGSRLPPHARGWTQPDVGFSIGADPDGFPPHARGWTRPGGITGAHGVSPARAGMDRLRTCARAGMDLRPLPPFPPHARGWTPLDSPNRPLSCVSPARAGMDPIPGLRDRHASSFPRTRGDGPGRTTVGGTGYEFPPHARGWTCPLPCRPRSGPVFPTHAGMDPRAPRHRP